MAQLMERETHYKSHYSNMINELHIDLQLLETSYTKFTVQYTVTPLTPQQRFISTCLSVILFVHAVTAEQITSGYWPGRPNFSFTGTTVLMNQVVMLSRHVWRVSKTDYWGRIIPFRIFLILSQQLRRICWAPVVFCNAHFIPNVK